MLKASVPTLSVWPLMPMSLECRALIWLTTSGMIFLESANSSVLSTLK
jgi:hypothetical protein